MISFRFHLVATAGSFVHWLVNHSLRETWQLLLTHLWRCRTEEEIQEGRGNDLEKKDKRDETNAGADLIAYRSVGFKSATDFAVTNSMRSKATKDQCAICSLTIILLTMVPA